MGKGNREREVGKGKQKRQNSLRNLGKKKIGKGTGEREGVKWEDVKGEGGPGKRQRKGKG